MFEPVGLSIRTARDEKSV